MDQKIVPNLWFDDNALQAAEFYVTTFEHSKILHNTVIPDTPSGDAQSVTFELDGIVLSAISGGPFFTFNPSISFYVFCDTKEEVDRLWKKMNQNATILMELMEYPFMKYFGWIQDQFGLSWQICLDESRGKEKQKIVPCLLFSSEVAGNAQKALDFYQKIFTSFKFHKHEYYDSEELIQKQPHVKYAEFEICNFTMVVMDHIMEADFSFNEAISFMISCENQEELDLYWEALSYDVQAEQCGWLKDQFGLSWQIIPKDFGDIMSYAAPEKMEKLTKAFLKMKKLDMKKLKEIAESDL